VVSSTPRPHFTPRKDPIPIVQEANATYVECTNESDTSNNNGRCTHVRIIKQIISEQCTWMRDINQVQKHILGTAFLCTNVIKRNKNNNSIEFSVYLLTCMMMMMTMIIIIIIIY